MHLNIKRSSRPFAISLISALVTFIVYLPALQNDFVTLDDTIYVLQNEHIKSLNFKFVIWSLSDLHVGNWHPLTWVSHAFDYALWGLNPFGHHLTSVLFHAINAFLVTLLAVKLIETYKARKHHEDQNSASIYQTPVLLAGIVTGLLFGLHPLHVESVAWISERKDVLYAFFFLIALLEYIRYVSALEASGPYRGMHENAQRAYVSALLLFCLALTSKPMAITFPAVLLILDWFPFQRLRTSDKRRRAFLEKIPFIMISLVLAGITFFAQKNAHAFAELLPIPLAFRIMNAAKALMEYLQHMVLPLDLIPLYPHPYWVNPVLMSPHYLLPAIAVVLISACSIILVKRQRIWFAVWATYVIMLLPVLGIIQVGAQGMADRYTYLPSVGPFLVMGLSIGWAGDRIIAAGARKTDWAGLMIALCLFVILISRVTIKQIHIWKDGVTLWSHELDILKTKYSQDFFVIRTAYAGRGLAHMRNGSYESAIDDYSQAIYVKPDAENHERRAIAYAKLGRIGEAIQDFTSAIAMDPQSATLYYNRGTAYAKRGSFSEAIEDLSKALSLSTEPNADYYMNRGNALKKLGRLDAGERDLIEAKKLRMRSEN
jgi:protein O-mannosyl-transferase